LKIHAGLSESVSAVAVEHQVASFQVDGIFQVPRSGLVGRIETGGIGFQVDLHVSLGDHIAGFGIEAEVVAVDTVEAGGISPVERDADFVKIGASVEFEFFDAPGADGEEGAASLGFGELEPPSACCAGAGARTDTSPRPPWRKLRRERPASGAVGTP
jgi:hypothetical protein